MDAKSPDFVQSLDRGLRVIRCFDGDHSELTLSEVAALTGLTRAAARRFLLTLESVGYVRQTDRRFSLTPRVLELGYSYLSSLTLPEIVMPHLKSLAEQLGAASSLAVLVGHDVVYIARVATKRIMSVNINIGTRFPAFATSLGRAMLACLPPAKLEIFLDQVTFNKFTEHTITDRARLEAELDVVRSQGWALLDQELEEGLRSLAAPIRDSLGHPVAAVNISIPSLGQSVESILANTLEPLREHVAAIEADLHAAN